MPPFEYLILLINSKNDLNNIVEQSFVYNTLQYIGTPDLFFKENSLDRLSILRACFG